MNLLFDLTAAQPNADGKYHGGGKYAKIVFIKLIEYAKKKSNLNIHVLIDKTKFVDSDINAAIINNNILQVNFADTSIENIINKYKIDRFYSSQIDSFKNIEKIKCPIIGAIHGLRGLETEISWHALLYEQGIKKLKMALKIIFFKAYQKRQLKHFSKKLKIENLTIYVVSNHTKYAIKTFFPEINIDNTNVFYSPDVIAKNSTEANNESSYFLMVSGNRWLKNNLRAAIALDQVISDFPDLNIKIIITGVTNKSIYLKHLKHHNNFSLLDYVTEDELSNLYQNAFALIYPTLNEGFGYPPLEAMHFGVPVIASALTSVSEVCGDAVLYTNPYSIDEIKNRILQLLLNESIYQNLKSEGQNRYSFIKNKQNKDLNALIEFITS